MTLYIHVYIVLYSVWSIKIILLSFNDTCTMYFGPLSIFSNNIIPHGSIHWYVHVRIYFTTYCTCTCMYMLPPYLNGVAVGQGVKAHCTGILSTEEVDPYLVLWVGVVNTQVLYPGGKAFVQPQVSPPLHGHLTSHECHVTLRDSYSTYMYTCTCM